MRAIFIDQSVRVRFCAAYSFNLYSNSGEGLPGFSRYGALLNDHMPNPHINRFGCTGDYRKTMRELLSRGDYVMAIEQASASCRTLTLSDTSARTFCNNLFGSQGMKEANCIELPNGSVVTATEAIKYLKEENNNG